MAGTLFKNLTLGTAVLTAADYTALEGLINAKASNSDLQALSNAAVKGIKLNGNVQALGEGNIVDLGNIATSESLGQVGTRLEAVENAINAAGTGILAEIAALKLADTGLGERIDGVEAKLGSCTAEDVAVSKSYVDGLVAAVPKFATTVVDELPTEGIKYDVVYLVRNSGSEEGQLYSEWIYVKISDAESKWEKLGEAKIDLTPYATTEAVNAAIKGVTDALDEHEKDAVAHITSAEREAWNAKQAALSAEQLAAANSGVTAEKVAKYDGYDQTIAGKAQKLGNLSDATTVAELIVALGGTIA
jgi:hypothetical protein